MDVSALTNINLIFEDISPGIPVGGDLRENVLPSSLYYKAKELRAAARKIERRYEEGDLTANANSLWLQLQKICIEILSKESKDIGVAAWLIESLLRNAGFSGLKDGFLILRKLIEKYWDNLYPKIDNEGISTRIAPLVGLNGEDRDGTLIAPILKTHITEGKDAGPFSLWQYIQAIQIEKITDADKRNQRLINGAVSLEDIEHAVNETSPKFFIGLIADVQESLNEFISLTEILKEKCGDEAPPSSNIKSKLEDSLDIIKAISSKVIQKFQNEQSENISLLTSIPEEEPVKNFTIIPQHREEALQMLLHIADFFRRREPQSPMPYILERAVRWGRMDLHQLLIELIDDVKVKEEIFRLTGIDFYEETKTN